jgi:hypothetical protein
VVLEGNFSLSITQSQGSLGGTYSLTGNLTDGISTVALAGGGSLGGTIASGSNPSVNITATSGICPNVQVTLSGAYDSANRAITFPNTTIPVFDNNCQVVLTFPNIVAVLRR